MRIVYHKKGQWDLFRRKKFVLGRHPKKRWHFIRILCTQLMEHERIKLTAVRAFHLRPTILRILRLARKFLKTEDERYFKKVQGYLTTQLAIEKLFKEIMPRLENQTGLSVNIKKLDKFRCIVFLSIVLCGRLWLVLIISDTDFQEDKAHGM